MGTDRLLHQQKLYCQVPASSYRRESNIHAKRCLYYRSHLKAPSSLQNLPDPIVREQAGRDHNLHHRGTHQGSRTYYQ
jgi:hypothetical protein